MYAIATFYKFVRHSEAEVQILISELEKFAKTENLLGLIILGQEGVNATIAGSAKCIANFKQFLLSKPKFLGTEFKDSQSYTKPFRRFKIREREEIVTLNDTTVFPEGDNNHLSAKQWNEVLESDEEFVLIDTRNDYETRLGVFEGAVDPQITMFGDFTKFVEKSDIPKDKKVLMYCTGGIRCEKASIAMQKLGYEKVYQLAGGILKYLEEFPNKHFKGECFVFDHRVAVDQELKPSTRYGLCPHCGNPGEESIRCINCSAVGIVCKSCLEDPACQTCSKNCHNHAIKKITKAA